MTGGVVLRFIALSLASSSAADGGVGAVAIVALEMLLLAFGEEARLSQQVKRGIKVHRARRPTTGGGPTGRE